MKMPEAGWRTARHIADDDAEAHDTSAFNPGKT